MGWWVGVWMPQVGHLQTGSNTVARWPPQRQHDVSTVPSDTMGTEPGFGIFEIQTSILNLTGNSGGDTTYPGQSRTRDGFWGPGHLRVCMLCSYACCGVFTPL